MNYFGPWICTCWSKKKVVMSLYEEGKEKIEVNLDMLRIIKNNLYNTATLKATLINL